MIKQALTLAALLAVVGFTPAIANDKDSAPEWRFTTSNVGGPAPATRSVVAPRRFVAPLGQARADTGLSASELRERSFYTSNSN